MIGLKEVWDGREIRKPYEKLNTTLAYIE